MTPAVLAQIHRAAFTQTRPWSATEFANLLEQQGMILCGDAKSFVLGRIIGDEAEVLTVATHPYHQRRGYALTHLLVFLDQARAQGATTVFLEVADTNISAKSLYYKQGFQDVGYRPRYYDTTDNGKVGADVLQLTF